MTPRVHEFPDLATLSDRAAVAAVRVMNDAVRSSGRCLLVLSGGSTPRTLYRLLATRFRDQVPWHGVHVFWGDERYVPANDSRSNYRMAKEALLDHVPCPGANIHPMPTGAADPDVAAREYEAVIRDHCGDRPPVFDLLLLGLGPEGHTASLFPGSPALAEVTRWVLPVHVPADPPQRLTLTFPALTHAVHTWFLVAGADKAHALREVRSGTADPQAYPAAGVRPVGGGLAWWLDKDAAAS